MQLAISVAGTDEAALELSALRESELLPLLDALPTLDLSRFRCVSIHAPSQFTGQTERALADALLHRSGTMTIVVHPDAISDFGCWRPFGSRLCIENMDKRKPIGRNCRELATLFEQLPGAGLCLDQGHARQIDPTMDEASEMLRLFGGRVREVHLSEVASNCRHERLSLTTILAFRKIAPILPQSVPVIIESVLGQPPIQGQLVEELGRARQALYS